MKLRSLSILLLLIFSIAIFSNVNMVNASDIGNIVSYRELRYENMVGQTSWWSCGPAAITTLLNYYYKITTSEQEIIQLIFETSGNDKYLLEGIDLLLIKDIFKSYGIEAIGYRIDPMSLLEYFEQGGLPLVLYFTKPRNHYVVCIGQINKKALLIADPSFGHIVTELNSLEIQKGFYGIVLATVPFSDSQFNNVKIMQGFMLSIYKNRYNTLRNLKY